MKDLKNGKRDALRASVAQAVRRQIVSAPGRELPVFSDPSSYGKSHQTPHQGKREIEKRRKRIAAGKLTEANGLIRN